jgi:Condensation domain
MKPASLETVFELSPMQNGVLFHALYAPRSSVYVNQSVLSVDGAIDADAMGRAWSRVIDRHQVLRCSFFWEGIDRPVQAVHRHAPLVLARHDWRHLDATAQEAGLTRFLAEDRTQPFDLRRPPQMRIALIRTGDEKSLLVWTRHHILFDGWSQALLLREVFWLYEAFRLRPDGTFDEEPLIGAAIPFERYIAWLQTHRPASPESFWRNHLAGVRGATPLGLAVAPKAAIPAQFEIAHELPGALIASMEPMVHRAGVTLASVYQAIWALIISARAGCGTVVFGTTVSGRPATIAGIERMVGLFINSLPIRAQVDAARDVLALALQLQQQHLRLIEYQHSPLTDIQRWAQAPRTGGLFDSVVVVGNYPAAFAGEDRVSSLRVTAARSHVENSLPVTLRIMPGAATTISILYDATRLDRAGATAMLEQFTALLAFVATTPDPSIQACLARLRDDEQARVQAALTNDKRRLRDARRHSAVR